MILIASPLCFLLKTVHVGERPTVPLRPLGEHCLPWHISSWDNCILLTKNSFSFPWRRSLSFPVWGQLCCGVNRCHTVTALGGMCVNTGPNTSLGDARVRTLERRVRIQAFPFGGEQVFLAILLRALGHHSKARALVRAWRAEFRASEPTEEAASGRAGADRLSPSLHCMDRIAELVSTQSRERLLKTQSEQRYRELLDINPWHTHMCAHTHKHIPHTHEHTHINA